MVKPKGDDGNKKVLPSCKSACNLVTWVRFLLLFVLSFSMQVVLGGQIVKYLPGYDGELPFKLETGYVSVGDSELFYYFIESEGNPDKDPLTLWLSGGPGCTSFSGLINEVGPLEYEVETYIGGLPNLKYNRNARTKVSSMLFVDAPVGTGYSYSRTQEGWATSDTRSSEEIYHFLRKWLVEHPKYLSVQIFIAGSSYSGMTVPLITKLIVDGNKQKSKPYINIKGYMAESPMTNDAANTNSKVEFAHGVALISDEIYENAKRSCNNKYEDRDPTNEECKIALTSVYRSVKDVEKSHILKPNCDLFTEFPNVGLSHESAHEGIRELLASQSVIFSDPWCKFKTLTEGNIYGNDAGVQEALHVRKGTKTRFTRCNGTLLYDYNVLDVVPIYKELSTSGLKLLVATGDHDMMVTHTYTISWVNSLNLHIVDDWRPWYVDDQVAGYTMKYSEDGFNLTLATVKAAGHPAATYKRKECSDLFQRWLHDLPA